MQTPLTSNDDLTTLTRAQGINTWEQLIDVVQDLAYGRNTDQADSGIILKEKKGTCSTKHIFLKRIADLNGIDDVKLMIGIYKMTEANTPKIGNILSQNRLSYIPEAHCYLRIDDIEVDATSPEVNFEVIRAVLLNEIEIRPDQGYTFKRDYHRRFIVGWLSGEKMNMTLEEIWNIREKCIRNIGEAR